MTLSDQQVTFFETFGYLAFPGLFAEEVEAITAEFERIWADHGGGHNRQTHDHQRRSALVPFIDQSEHLSALLDDPRVDNVASTLLGDDYSYEASDGNFYVGDTDWHSDGFNRRKYRFLKFAFYLGPRHARDRVPARDPGQPSSRRRLCRGASANHGEQPVGIYRGRTRHLGPRRARHCAGVTAGRHGDVQPGPQARVVWGRDPAAHVHHQRVPAL